MMTEAQMKLIRDLEAETGKYPEQQKPEVEVRYLREEGHKDMPIIILQNDLQPLDESIIYEVRQIIQNPAKVL